MKSIQTLGRVVLPSVLLGTLAFGTSMLLNGTEALGPPVGITLAPGSDILMAGTGLRHAAGVRTSRVLPNVIELDVPAGVTVEQVLLYWEGQASTELEQEDIDTILVSSRALVNGRALVEGDRIGGATRFFNGAWSSSYRADITDLGIVGTGTNLVHVSGTDFGMANNGAGILVIVDDGVTASDIQIQDGNDCAFYQFQPPLDTTAPVTYTFAPVAAPRQAKLGLFVGSAGANRPSIVTISIDGDLFESLIDQVNDGDGAEWDTLEHEFTVPPGASSVTLQCLSADSGIGPYEGELPISLTWVTAGLRLEEFVACSGRIGNFVWEDGNGNGLQDPAEEGIPGVEVMLLDSAGVLITVDTTDSTGAYLFEGLCAGDYLVEVYAFSVPAGYEPTLCEQGSDVTIDSNCSPAAVSLITDSDEDLTIDFGFTPPTGGGDEGCSHGYWKQSQHFDSWASPYDPGDLFSAYFEDAFPGMTLLEVLWLKGGKLNALGRETVAALLNAASPDVAFELAESEVIDLFNDTYPGRNYNNLKDFFEFFNTIGCPLN